MMSGITTARKAGRGAPLLFTDLNQEKLIAKKQNTFAKRQREMEKKYKAQEKRKRREQRKTADDDIVTNPGVIDEPDLPEDTI